MARLLTRVSRKLQTSTSAQSQSTSCLLKNSVSYHCAGLGSYHAGYGCHCCWQRLRVSYGPPTPLSGLPYLFQHFGKPQIGCAMCWSAKFCFAGKSFWSASAARLVLTGVHAASINFCTSKVTRRMLNLTMLGLWFSRALLHRIDSTTGSGLFRRYAFFTSTLPNH